MKNSNLLFRSLLRVSSLALLTLAGAGLVPAGAAEQGGKAKPNVVVLLVDDAALMDFGIYGGEARTPNIDALAGRGAMFTRSTHRARTIGKINPICLSMPRRLGTRMARKRLCLRISIRLNSSSTR